MPLSTRVLLINPASPDPAIIKEAAAVLQAGGLVAFPTETVYGLGADATDAAAVARIFEAKGRPATDPLIVHIAQLTDLDVVARDVPPLLHLLAEQFWPGALTLILPRNDRIPASVSAGRDTVAVRMPSHPVARALIQAAGVPIAAPSANLFSHTSPTTAQHVLDDLEGRIDLVLDGGATPIGVESTVLDLTAPVPTLLRPGGVSLEQLQDVVPQMQVREQFLAQDEVAAAPGQLLKHYAPHAQLTIYEGERQAVLSRLRVDVAAAVDAGGLVGILVTDKLQFKQAIVIAVGETPEAVASHLYAALREFDGHDVTHIFAYLPLEQGGIADAIRDRLIRAAEGRVVRVDSIG